MTSDHWLTSLALTLTAAVLIVSIIFGAEYCGNTEREKREQELKIETHRQELRLEAIRLRRMTPAEAEAVWPAPYVAP